MEGRRNCWRYVLKLGGVGGWYGFWFMGIYCFVVVRGFLCIIDVLGYRRIKEDFWVFVLWWVVGES